MADVKLERVGKTYPGAVRAVRDVTLAVHDGEFVVLIGASGSGKTTLLRVIAGLEEPTAGEVLIGGRVVTRLLPHLRDVAMVFQRPALYPHLTVRANLAFGLGQRRWFWGRSSVNDKYTAVEEVARSLGLGEVLERRPGELSGGQQQRVALGRALVRRPAVFLLDEPLSNLDAPLRLEMRRELHLLQRRLRATMIYVTHDQDEAMTLGDRVVVLDRGTVQQVGRPADLYARPANRLVAGLVGWPPMNLLEGELVEQDSRLSFRRAGIALPLPAELWEVWRGLAGRRVILGIRPEDVRVLGRPVAEGMMLTAEVRLVERLGLSSGAPTCGPAANSPERVSLLTLELGDWQVTARVEGGPPVMDGTVAVAFDLSRAHLFDAVGGGVLASPVAASPGDRN
jgi:multiple sugar transport system ATP-binding protein